VPLSVTTLLARHWWREADKEILGQG